MHEFLAYSAYSKLYYGVLIRSYCILGPKNTMYFLVRQVHVELRDRQVP